jgi:exopolysaccharide biosynthesis polyprenyl glycosylphosphotransferase
MATAHVPTSDAQALALQPVLDRPIPARPAGKLSNQRARRSAHWLFEGAGWTPLRVGSDALMLIAAAFAAVEGAGEAGISAPHLESVIVFPPLTLALLWARGLYRRRLRTQILDAIAPLAGVISVSAMILIVGDVIASGTGTGYQLIARAWLFALLYVSAGRVVLLLNQQAARTRGLLAQPALIIGSGEIAAHLARRLRERPEFGLEPVGFLDGDAPDSFLIGGRSIPLLGRLSDLPRVLADTAAVHVIFAFSNTPDRSMLPYVRECEARGLSTWVIPRLFDAVNERVALEHLGGMPLLSLRHVDPKGRQFAVKHAFDRVVAPLLLVVLAPLMAAVALAVRLGSPGPILFRQTRIGRDGQVFDLLKFRSMRADVREGPKWLPSGGCAPGGVEGADRRTKVGYWLRRTALDELPQLLNVVRGEMSLVGPRPERPEFVELFATDIDRYSERHRVKSGITGWAQVNGLRGQTSVADRVEWDNYYIENWSLWLDLKVLATTIPALFRRAE